MTDKFSLMDSQTNLNARSKRAMIKIREMEIDDLAEVYHLGEDLFQAEETTNMYRTWDALEVAELFRGDTEFCLVAEKDDALIGFALGTTITKSHSAWKYGHLIWLGVKPEFRRLNVAEKLFQRFKDIMMKNGVRMLIVDTSAENLPALHFFRKMGFGHPHQHIYLFMNLAADHQRLKNKKNERSPSRNKESPRRK